MKRLLMICAVLWLGCGGAEDAPVPPYSYQGPIDGDYMQAEEWTDACLDVKECMGLGDIDYPLPDIRIYTEGYLVDCVGEQKAGCYWDFGRIDVTESARTPTIAHECIHHWLEMDTGNLQPGHASEFFCTCGLTDYYCGEI